MTLFILNSGYLNQEIFRKMPLISTEGHFFF